MERSIEIMVAVLGILKAGGAYVPLDIEHPKERLAVLLDDARPTVLLTQRRLIDRLPELKAVQAVCIDELSSREGVKAQTQSGDAPLRPRGDGPASGSTGIPKGISIPQSAVSRLVFNTNYVDLQSSDVVAFSPEPSRTRARKPRKLNPGHGVACCFLR